MTRDELIADALVIASAALRELAATLDAHVAHRGNAVPALLKRADEMDDLREEMQ